MGTPGSRRKLPIAPRRRPSFYAARVAAARQREAEILQRFGARLAGLELALPRAQWTAARRALLLEQAQALAAARALALAERLAAMAIMRRSRPGDLGRNGVRGMTGKNRARRPSRTLRRRHRPPAPHQPGG